MASLTIGILGAGYVGTSTGLVFARKCPKMSVIIADKDEAKIKPWQNRQPVFFEPGIVDLYFEALEKNNNIQFTNDIESFINSVDIIFVCVNTPMKSFGIGENLACDLSNIEEVTRTIGSLAKAPKIIVEKSTVPVKSSEVISEILRHMRKPEKLVNNNGLGLDDHVVLSNPEFMAEGRALEDLLHPDRVLIGSNKDDVGARVAVQLLTDVYMHWVPRERILHMGTWSSELAKLVANAFLAQRVSSINSISAICERTGADIEQVAKAIGLDRRIGSKFLHAGVGFGGSCFRKDIQHLIYLATCLGLPEVASYWKGVLQINEYQQERFVKMMFEKMYFNLVGKKIVMFGYAFKNNTCDTRESPAIFIARKLLEERVNLHIYDPIVPKERIIHSLEPYQIDSNFVIHSNPSDAVKDSHAIVICTDWDEFKDYNYEEFHRTMVHPAFLFDGRILLNHDHLRKLGFIVSSIGV